MRRFGPRSRGAFAPIATVLCAGIVSSLAVSITSSPAQAGSLPSPARENVTFFYENVAGYSDSELKYKLAGASVVVVSPQGDPSSSTYWQREADAARRIKATGAVPIHYVEYIWRRDGQSDFGVDLTAHPEWRFCYPGSNVAVSARRDRASGGYYIDLNERGARQAADSYMYHLKLAGYQGLFYDIVRRTYILGLPHTTSSGGKMSLSNLKSGCTGSPVSSGRSLALSYMAAMDNMRVKHGMFTVVNCCVPSLLSRSSVGGATHIRDTANRFVNEATKTSVNWPDIQRENAESQSSGRVWNFQCAETPSRALYAWARAKLWRQPVALNTGHGATSGSCLTAVNQWGVWGELSNARLGTPLDSSYKRGQCESGSSYLCFFWRRYTNGIVVINNGRYKLGSGRSIGLVSGSMPSCVYLGEVRPPSGGTGTVLQYPVGVASNRCISATSLDANQYSGRVFLYRSTPWS